MYMNGKFNPQIKISSKSYVVLCYSKMKRSWFTQDDYKAFQLNRQQYIKDIYRNFEALCRFGYLAKHEDEFGMKYRITADGDHCLRMLGKKRVEDYAEMLRELGEQGNFAKAKKD